MMSRLYDTVEPSVINEEMLLAAVKEQGPRDEKGKVAKHDGVEFDEVKSLRLDYQNILKIDNLWCFTNLVKLQLDNNIIEKIEGLDILVKLVWLDLSFNNIEVIEGLDKLTQLEDLTLFNNRIQHLENMDTLTKLHVLSVGNNDLKELDNVIYLRRFKLLQTINLAGNPISRLEEYKTFVIAHLPYLEYLDYRLVDQATKNAAYEQYESQLQEIQLDEEQAQKKADEEAKLEAELTLHKAAYIDNLNGSLLFDSMYTEDKDGQKINKVPGVEELLFSYKERFTSVCQEMFEYGLQAHEEREIELKTFRDAIEAAKLDNRQQAAVKIDEFMVYKQKIFDQLAAMTNEMTAEITIAEYQQNVNELWDVLMGLEMQLVEQLEETIKDFERNLTDMVATFVENIQALTAQCRELENQHHERIVDMTVRLLNKGIKTELDSDLTEQLQEVFIDKETLLNALATSHDVHLQRVDAREEDMTSSIRHWLTTIVDDLHDREEHRRNRSRVTEINHLIDHLRDDVDNVEMTFD